MIIVDFSGILVQNVHALVAMNDHFDATLYKQMTLHSILSYKKKFSKEYGKIVFAMDKKPYWRTEVFPHYKAGRKEATKKQQARKAHIDWDASYVVMNEIMDDLQEIFPYKVIKLDRCEADDIIGVLCKEIREPIMIISRDGDFKQLQRYPNVKQFDPVGKKLIKEPNPESYLKEHIIRGDNGDGICNILSSDDSLVTKTKQCSIYSKDVKKWINMDAVDFAETTDILKRFNENEKLIDLSMVPDDIQEVIIAEYNKPNEGHNKRIQGYLIKNRLANLLGELQYFLEKDVVKERPSLTDLM